MLTHKAPKECLIVGALNPLTIEAASAYGGRVDVLDRAASAVEVRNAAGGGHWSMPAGARLVKSPQDSYDVIIVEVPAPLESFAAASETTREALAAWHKRLKPEGILALRLPRSWFQSSTARPIRAIAREFREGGAFQLTGGLLVLAADGFFFSDPLEMVSRIPAPARKEDPGLEDYLRGDIQWRYPLSSLADPKGSVDTLDRAVNALPLRDLLTAPVPD
jgi:hypothetical protein